MMKALSWLLGLVEFRSPFCCGNHLVTKTNSVTSNKSLKGGYLVEKFTRELDKEPLLN